MARSINRGMTRSNRDSVSLNTGDKNEVSNLPSKHHSR
jgi:hypothetical protein